MTDTVNNEGISLFCNPQIRVLADRLVGVRYSIEDIKSAIRGLFDSHSLSGIPLNETERAQLRYLRTKLSDRQAVERAVSRYVSGKPEHEENPDDAIIGMALIMVFNSPTFQDWQGRTFMVPILADLLETMLWLEEYTIGSMLDMRDRILQAADVGSVSLSPQEREKLKWLTLSGGVQTPSEDLAKWMRYLQETLDSIRAKEK